MSKSLGSNGSWSKAKNPGFSTAQTYQEAIDLTVHIQVSIMLVKQNKIIKDCSVPFASYYCKS